MSEPIKLTVEQALDHYTDYAAMAACQIAATRQQPYLTHASGENDRYGHGLRRSECTGT
jgi:hypothetical protein